MILLINEFLSILLARAAIKSIFVLFTSFKYNPRYDAILPADIIFYPQNIFSIRLTLLNGSII